MLVEIVVPILVSSKPPIIARTLGTRENDVLYMAGQAIVGEAQVYVPPTRAQSEFHVQSPRRLQSLAVSDLHSSAFPLCASTGLL